MKIGIIGPSQSGCSNELYDLGIRLCRQIAAKNKVFICGGLGGFMEAVCKGVKFLKKLFRTNRWYTSWRRRCLYKPLY
ncbi:MAG: hypothetical protein M0R16_01450 [Bacteroidales bacterium]|nr:hypothetical protein [Bacteroidales bacterium]